MQAIIERCCGLDVHQETVVACVLIGAPGERPRKEIRTFRTMTRDLEALRDWLQELGVTHVGMESTGVYWRPVYAVLEGCFELIVGNARHPAGHRVGEAAGRRKRASCRRWLSAVANGAVLLATGRPPG
jgi:transposase